MTPLNTNCVLEFLFWGFEGDITGRLAAKADGDIRYVTFSTQALVKSNLLPADHGLNHGDSVATLLDGHFTLLKVNRKNRNTLAAHLAPPLEMPTLDDSGAHPKIYKARILGPLVNPKIIAPANIHDHATPAPQASHESILESRPSIPTPTLDWFDVLGVSKLDSLEIVKKAFRDLVKTNHPDVGGSHERMTAINQAYATALVEFAKGATSHE